MRICYALPLLALLWMVPNALKSQVFKIYENFSELEERLAQSKNHLVVVNFWATFCRPCVEELPYFNTLHEKYASPNFEILLVSLDFKSSLEKKFVPFLREKNLRPEVILLAERGDEWIRRLDPRWEGLIPVTLLVWDDHRTIHQGNFESYEELEQFIDSFFKNIGRVSPIF